jgi:hypothetical protein
MTGTVYVVHCVDTEGPLYETPKVFFEQLHNIYGIDIEPTKENFDKLHKGQLDVGEYKEAIMELAEHHKLSTKGTWDEVGNMVKKVTSPEYRKLLPDSNGNGWKYSWFCMDHVGFTGANPRHRAKGYHEVFDRYMGLVTEQNLGDIVQFHYHPSSLSGNYNDSGTAFWGKDTLNQILARRIIDRKWFPSVFRPGFHTERPDSHWFLEQWIPFDYGNQAMIGEDTMQPDLSVGRFGDWRRAPIEWHPYHPDYRDYQKKGDCHRFITRCLNMHARLREINKEDVRQAFEEAAGGRNTILAFTDHDYKDMESEIVRVRSMIEEVSSEYSAVRFEYANALEAMQKCLNLHPEPAGLKCEINYHEVNPILVIKTDKPIFGPQPFLAIKNYNGSYYWDNLDFYGEQEWHYTFDTNTIGLDDVENIGVAVNSETGVAEVWLLRQGN